MSLLIVLAGMAIGQDTVQVTRVVQDHFESNFPSSTPVT